MDAEVADRFGLSDAIAAVLARALAQGPRGGVDPEVTLLRPDSAERPAVPVGASDLTDRVAERAPHGTLPEVPFKPPIAPSSW